MRGRSNHSKDGPGDRLRFPPEYPKANRDYHHEPRLGWQMLMRQETLLELGRRGWQRRGATLLCFEDYMVQVYLDNWTLHFQISIDGEEFNDERYGDLSGKYLICFDLESGNRKGVAVSDIKQLQREVTAALTTAGADRALGLPAVHPLEHHIVWEAFEVDDVMSPEAVEAGARRVIDYMDAIFDIASPIMDRLQPH